MTFVDHQNWALAKGKGAKNLHLYAENGLSLCYFKVERDLTKIPKGLEKKCEWCLVRTNEIESFASSVAKLENPILPRIVV